GGRSWTRVLQAMSRCGGGTPAGGGDYERASDPWVDIGLDGTVYALALAFSGNSAQSPANAVLASRSVDGGLTWSAPATLASDGAAFFNDKTSLTVDPTDPSHVYAVWDRLVNATGAGPTMLARSTDSGVTWEPARAIYAPPGSGQTIGNRIVALNGGPEAGTLIDFFTQIDSAGAAPHLDVIRSTDKGTTWSAPSRIAALQSVGTRDPETGTLARDGGIIGSIAAGPGGVLWATWQDARFSGGARDAIAVAHSNDGGRTWSAPLAVNRDPGVAAFTPVINVRADGTVGVLHYDLRPNTTAPDTLLAAAWLLTSRDGIAWTETSVWSPFDLDGAPRVVDGLFLGDYEGLVSTNTTFLPVLVLSSSDATNRTDVYAMTFAGLAAANADLARMHAARAANPASAEALPPAAFVGRVRDHTTRSLAARLPTGAAGRP
ncbi:MAG TPA: sialidase family protein, partial [Caldimonas sp.]